MTGTTVALRAGFVEDRMGLDVADDAISWDQAAAWIAAGTVQHLANLQRSEAGLASYRQFREQTLQEFESILDYLKAQLFQCEIHLNQDGKKCASICEHVLQQAEPVVSWRKNDFPYNFGAGIEHYVLWSSKPLSQERIQSVIAEQLPGQETLRWINPPELQSIAALWHCHILARSGAAVRGRRSSSSSSSSSSSRCRRET